MSNKENIIQTVIVIMLFGMLFTATKVFGCNTFVGLYPNENNSVLKHTDDVKDCYGILCKIDQSASDVKDHKEHPPKVKYERIQAVHELNHTVIPTNVQEGHFNFLTIPGVVTSVYKELRKKK
ncbi:MAG: hypothetical protein MRY83_23745 [Flavobacteriales bacterium]|nr:hypothetical protein [Flavobacteriales bacterium]